MGTASKTNGNIREEMVQMLGTVPEWMDKVPASGLPGLWAQCRDFHLAETKIPNKYKELIGLGVAAATRCKYCVLFHTEAAKVFGATEEEIAEASLMAGVTMNISTFVNAQQIDFEKFRKETLGIVSFVKQQMAAKPKTGARPPSAHA